ncbi:MAG: hypothetical protein U0350_39825 [Caldilineaceae bacterium]
MKSLKENLPYVLLILVAFGLIFTTIRLQALIMSTRSDPGTGQASPGLLTTLRQQIAFAIMPLTDTPTITPVPPTATATVTFTPTPPPPTPVPPSATPLPTLTPMPVPPTPAPPSPAALPTETAVLPATAAPSSPTTVILVPTFTPTAVPPTPAPTNTPTPAPDLRLGYLERGDGCGVITEIVQLMLENNLKYRVERVAFTDSTALFAQVASTDAQTKVDWTMCYTDPDDRSYLARYSGFLVVIGGVYGQPAGKNHLIMSNGPFKRELQQNKRCVLELLKDFKLEASSLQGQSAQAWLNNHSEQVQTWTHCQ